MTKFLTLFDTQAAYNAAESNLDLPNVSLIAATNAVIYKPVPTTETRVVAKFNVTDTSEPTNILMNTDNISAIEIDGVAQTSVTTTYTFTTTGEHTVKYTLTDPTSIGNEAFYQCSSLTSVTIPNSVTSIGNSAFYQCSGLTSVTIGSGVTSIGSSAFNGCTMQTSNFINNSSLDAEENDYWGCAAYDTIVNGMMTRGNIFVKYDCSSASVTIPNGITSIGNNAFSGCSSLTSVTIPNSVTTIGMSAFKNCKSLTSVDIPNSVTSIGYYVFQGCSGLTSVTIGSGVTSIGTYTFAGCSGLTSITIPNSVESIGNNAFNGCTSLTSITSLRTTAPTIQSRTFNNVKTGGTLTVPSGSSGYDVWMGTGNYYLGKYNWTKVEQ